MMCICNLDLTLMSLYKESSLLYWSGFKKDVGLQDLVKLVFSAHSAINLEGNLQICQTFINRRISLEMGPEITRSLWGFITETKTRAMWTAFPCLLQPSSQWFSTFSASAPLRDFTHIPHNCGCNSQKQGTESFKEPSTSVDLVWTPRYTQWESLQRGRDWLVPC